MSSPSSSSSHCEYAMLTWFNVTFSNSNTFTKPKKIKPLSFRKLCRSVIFEIYLRVLIFEDGENQIFRGTYFCGF